MSRGAALIAAERARQIAKGYTAEHDRRHACDELLAAAEAYLNGQERWIPWHMDDAAVTRFQDQTRAERLTKAGALLAAAIDLLLEATDD